LIIIVATPRTKAACQFLRTVVSVGAIVAAIISAAPGAVRADLIPNGHFVQSAASLQISKSQSRDLVTVARRPAFPA
jgi:hypothetical protein